MYYDYEYYDYEYYDYEYYDYEYYEYEYLLPVTSSLCHTGPSTTPYRMR